MKIADITQARNGRIKVRFLQLAIYKIIKDTLEFKYTTLNKRKYFLQFQNGYYEISNFHLLKDTFYKFMKDNFEKLDFNLPIDYRDFMEEYYRLSPIKNSAGLRFYLSEDIELSDKNLDLLLRKIDFKYANKAKDNDMLAFLKEEGFTETTDKVGNFHKDCPLYYKKITKEKFFVVTRPCYSNITSQSAYDFDIITCSSPREFLINTNPNYQKVITGFDSQRDQQFYELEVFKLKRIKSHYCESF